MKRRQTLGLYPGTFDPVTNGHIDLVQRALRIFDRVLVAVASEHTEKHPLFSPDERMAMLKRAVRPWAGRVTVEPFDGLVVEFARKKGADTMIRGVRMFSDFEYEFQMALTNRKLSPKIETMFLMPHESYAYLSSRLIKEVASLGGDVRSFVPDFVWSEIRKKMGKDGRL